VTIVLTKTEFSAAVDGANKRFIAAATGQWSGHRDPEQTEIKRMTNDIIAVMAEIAVAKALGIFFVPPLNTFHKEPDIQPDIEVRATPNRNYSLMIRDNDDLDRKFVLVIVSDLSCMIAGWCYGYERDDLGTVKDPNGMGAAHFVPQSNLRPFDELFTGF
jgi:hypothetical protein